MSNPKLLRLAVAQIETVLGDLAANHRKHLDLIATARAGGADVLLFPELSLVGHGAGNDAPRLAMSGDDGRIRALAEASGPMCTVFGFIEEGRAGLFYNTAAALRGGGIACVHRKINLATYGQLEDGKYYAAGRRVQSFELTRHWHPSILICADMWNPALGYLAAMRKSTLLLGPISSAIEAVGGDFDNPNGWDVNARFHALTYGMPVAIANRVGREGDLRFWGGSRILDPCGRILALAQGSSEQLITADLDYGLLREARYLLPTVRDGNLLVVRDEVERLARQNDTADDGVDFSYATRS